MREKLISDGYALPFNFAGLPTEFSSWEDSQVVILPIPYDLTTSFQAGGRFGPQAILEASSQIELFDDELGLEPYTIGVHTLPSLEPIASGPEAMGTRIESVVQEILAAGKFPLTLGGDHSISIGVINAFSHEFKDLTVVQLDAHADLRDHYQGTSWSHACVGRRATEHATLKQIGIRSFSTEEAAFMDDSKVTTIYAREIQENLTPALAALNEIETPVYLTVDVDVFDPSIMPSTGTPEPGGLDWYAVLKIIRYLFENHRVIGADVVELSPIGGLKAPDFLVAKLVYKLIGYLHATNENRR